jgi:hypothetical protein
MQDGRRDWTTPCLFDKRPWCFTGLRGRCLRGTLGQGRKARCVAYERPEHERVILGYIVSDLERLSDQADGLGLDSLAYMLSQALAEARHQRSCGEAPSAVREHIRKILRRLRDHRDVP